MLKYLRSTRGTSQNNLNTKVFTNYFEENPISHHMYRTKTELQKVNNVKGRPAGGTQIWQQT